MEMELHPEQVFLYCVVLYLDFLLLTRIIMGVLSSPNERTWDFVEDTRENKTQWHTLTTDKANGGRLLSLLIGSETKPGGLCSVLGT